MCFSVDRFADEARRNVVFWETSAGEWRAHYTRVLERLLKTLEERQTLRSQLQVAENERDAARERAQGWYAEATKAIRNGELPARQMVRGDLTDMTVEPQNPEWPVKHKWYTASDTGVEEARNGRVTLTQEVPIYAIGDYVRWKDDSWKGYGRVLEHVGSPIKYKVLWLSSMPNVGAFHIINDDFDLRAVKDLEAVLAGTNEWTPQWAQWWWDTRNTRGRA